MCTYNNFVTGITISIWTVVQTCFHIVWAICGYYFYVCRIKPSHYGLVILYLTYFYKDGCGDIILEDNDNITWNKEKKNLDVLNMTDTEEKESIYNIVQTILDKAVLPKESSAAWRTNLYFFAFIFSDAIWIVSAFLLFAGTCFQIKKCLSLLFYCPWLVVTAVIVLLDVVASVHFGLDIYRIHNFTTWLKFIGVENYGDFSNFNSNNFSRIVPVIPAVLLCMLFSRCLIIWVLNIVNFFQIMNVAVLAFQDNLDGRNPRYKGKPGCKKSRRQDQYLDNSESRIRSWQLFYGAVEATSTASRSSSSSNSTDKDRNNIKSNNRPSKGSLEDQLDDADYPHRPPSENQANGRYLAPFTRKSYKNKSDTSLVSTYYHGYSDVAEGIDTNQNKIASIEPLRSELPWTYIQLPDEKYGREFRLSNIPARKSYTHSEESRESHKNIEVANTEL